jgi:hypothetical protein
MLGSLLFRLCIILPWLITPVASASAQFWDQPIEYCKMKSPTLRETAIYIDTSAIPTDGGDWVNSLIKRLNLASREHLTVSAISPSTSTSRQLFDTCFPGLTSSELAEQEAKRHVGQKVFGRALDRRLKDDQDAFNGKLRAELLRIRAEPSPIGKGTDILRALSLDRQRAPRQDRFWRLIIMGSFNSQPLEAALAGIARIDTPDGVNAAVNRYPAEFGGAEIYIFGLGASTGQYTETQIERFLRGYFQRTHANLVSFGSALAAQSGTVYLPPSVYSGRWQSIVQPQGGRATAWFVKPAEGGEVSGWFYIYGSKEIFSVPIGGSWYCGNSGECQFKGLVIDDVPFIHNGVIFRKGDLISLSGTEQALTGSIISAHDEQLENQDIKYTIRIEREKSP